MGCKLSKAKCPQVFKRKRATKQSKTTWYVELEETAIQSSSPLEQQMPQNTAQTSVKPTYYSEDFSTLMFMTRKGSEWVERYEREQLFACVKSCLIYEGFHQDGFYILTLNPRPFLEMKTYDGQAMYSLPGKNDMALEYFIRYILDEIETKVYSYPFVLVIQDINEMSGCSRLCARLVEKICQRVERRYKLSLETICIYRPSGLLAVDLSVRKRFNLPFVSHEVENKLVIANQSSLGKLAKATGFPGRMITEEEIQSGCCEFIDIDELNINMPLTN